MPDPADWPDTAPVLGLPYLQPAQAQKHVTVNEALRTLDAVVQLAVADRTLGVPPPVPEPGDRHIVGPGATGAWAGQEGRVALWEAFGDGGGGAGGGAWVFLTPGAGWRAWVAAEGAVVTHDGAAWVGPEALPLRSLRLGVGTDADATNRLAVAAPATLLTHAGAGHQVEVNKAAPADTASLLFQTGFSGRAEMGTAGSDAFAVKVSADGTAWSTALAADPATGRASLPGGLRLPAGSAAAPAAAFDNDADTGVFRPATNVLALAAGGAERVRVTTGGVQVTALVSGTAVTQNATDTTAGRLMKGGDWGLGATIAPQLPGQDFTTEMREGFWRLTESGAIGHPSTDAYFIGALVMRMGGSEAGSLGGHAVLTFRSVGTSLSAQRLRFGTRGTNTGALNWVEILHNGRIIGTVSQSAGLPTGAVIERGSNANGEYVRFADGTQICTRTLTASAGAATTWTFPAAFVAAPSMSGAAVAMVLSAPSDGGQPSLAARVRSARLVQTDQTGEGR